MPEDAVPADAPLGLRLRPLGRNPWLTALRFDLTEDGTA